MSAPRTPEERQRFIRARLETLTETLNDRRESLLSKAQTLAEEGDSPQIAALLPLAATEYCVAFFQLEAEKAKASYAADQFLTE